MHIRKKIKSGKKQNNDQYVQKFQFTFFIGILSSKRSIINDEKEELI